MQEMPAWLCLLLIALLIVSSPILLALVIILNLLGAVGGVPIALLMFTYFHLGNRNVIWPKV